MDRDIVYIISQTQLIVVYLLVSVFCRTYCRKHAYNCNSTKRKNTASDVNSMRQDLFEGSTSITQTGHPCQVVFFSPTLALLSRSLLTDTAKFSFCTHRFFTCVILFYNSFHASGSSGMR